MSEKGVPAEVYKVGDLVVKNPLTWIASEFDSWGRGLSVGEVVGTPATDPLMLDEGQVDVRWHLGRCFEDVIGLLPLRARAPTKD